MPAVTNSTSILRCKQVRERTGLSRSTLYLGIKQGTFPPPITLGSHSVGWVSTVIDQWIADKIAMSQWPLPAPPHKEERQSREAKGRKRTQPDGPLKRRKSAPPKRET